MLLVKNDPMRTTKRVTTEDLMPFRGEGLRGSRDASGGGASGSGDANNATGGAAAGALVPFKDGGGSKAAATKQGGGSSLSPVFLEHRGTLEHAPFPAQVPRHMAYGISLT